MVNRQRKARSVQVNWTDAARPEPYAMLREGRVRARIEDLLLLVDLIDAGRGTSDKAGAARDRDLQLKMITCCLRITFQPRVSPVI